MSPLLQLDRPKRSYDYNIIQTSYYQKPHMLFSAHRLYNKTSGSCNRVSFVRARFGVRSYWTISCWLLADDRGSIEALLLVSHFDIFLICNYHCYYGYGYILITNNRTFTLFHVITNLLFACFAYAISGIRGTTIQTTDVWIQWYIIIYNLQTLIYIISE